MESDHPSLWVQRGGASGAVRRERPQSWGSLKRSTHPEDPASPRMFPFFFFLKNIHLCIWLHRQVFLRPSGSCCVQTVSCSPRDLVP